jgi:hypothetical protein
VKSAEPVKGELAKSIGGEGEIVMVPFEDKDNYYLFLLESHVF